ncbi:MAG: ATPase domain-containing protein [Acidiferrobacteraceae bacterium]
MAANSKAQTTRCRTGIAGLDEVLQGGLPRDRIYLIRGEPGTGKTTLALQFLMEGRRQGETGMYVTLSESEDELHASSEAHGWSLDGIQIFDLSRVEQQFEREAQNTLFHIREVELGRTTAALCDAIDRAKPSRVVVDSLAEMRLLSETAFRFRRQILLLKQFLSERHATSILIDDLTSDYGDAIQTMVDGVIVLQMELPVFGRERRRLSVTKLRGVPFQGGHHDISIKTGGLQVFPRLRGGGVARPVFDRPDHVVSSGVPNLDALLGGGLDPGTSTLLIGPAGTGKSTIALQCVSAAADRNVRSVLYTFEEGEYLVVQRANSIGMRVQDHIAQGVIQLRKINPAELSPGEFAVQVQHAVEHDGVNLVVIDSLNGYMHAMAQEQHLVLQLHDLLSYLGYRGVTTVMVLAQQGVMHPLQQSADLTYLSDTVIITRYFEAHGAVRKAVSVIKKRTGFHEGTIRELQIGPRGVNVGPPLDQFQGVLAGVPTFVGTADSDLLDPDESRAEG